MNRFLGIIRKDIQLSKNTLLLPVWIVLGTYAISLILTGIAFITNDINLKFLDFNINSLYAADQLFIGIGFAAGHGLVVFPGILALIFIISLANSALNYEIKNNCEIFYRAQPISIWKISASKFITSIFGIMAVTFAIVIFEYLVSNIIFSIYLKPAWGISLIGATQNFLNFTIFGIMLGSFSFLCSALFKDKAFVKGLAIILGITLITTIVNALFDWNIPSLISLIIKFFFIGFKSFNILENATNADYNVLLEAINTGWKVIFSWGTLLKIAVSGVLFVGSTFLYKYKEIK